MTQEDKGIVGGIVVAMINKGFFNLQGLKSPPLEAVGEAIKSVGASFK